MVYSTNSHIVEFSTGVVGILDLFIDYVFAYSINRHILAHHVPVSVVEATPSSCLCSAQSSSAVAGKRTANSCDPAVSS